MPTQDLNVSAILSATGWTGATVANLSASDDVRATGGTAGELISADIDDAPGDFGSENTIQLHVEARTQGTVSRAKSLTVELRNASDTILETFTTATIGSTDATFSSSAFSRADDLTTINGYRLRATVLEGGGMADSATVEIDRLWAVLDYDVAGISGTLAATDPPDTASFAGDVLVQGSLAATEAADTASFAGDVLVQGALAATEAQDTAEFTGTTGDTISGSLAATDAPDTAAFAGDVLVQGDLAATEPADTASFAGDVLVSGGLAATEAPDTASFAGAVLISGTLAATEAQDTALFTGPTTSVPHCGLWSSGAQIIIPI